MYNKEWYEANKERILSQQRAYYERTKEQRREYRRQYYLNNKDKCKTWKSNQKSSENKEYKHNYYLNNKDKWEEYRSNLSEEQKKNRLQTIRYLKKNYGHTHKRELIEYKGSKCAICGTKYNGKNGAIFDFHHVNPNEKDFNITTVLRHYSKIPERVWKEVDKCILVCSNCHRQLHSDKY